MTLHFIIEGYTHNQPGKVSSLHFALVDIEDCGIREAPVVGIQASVFAADAPQVLQVSKHDFWLPSTVTVAGIASRLCCRVIPQQADQNI